MTSPSGKKKASSAANRESTPPTKTDKDGIPHMFDGKIARPTWQPSDGNGDASAELVEKNRNKKNGHPTWKLYTRNIPKPIQKNASEPPHFVYLDDRAAYDILQQPDAYTPYERHRYWPFDFDSRGKIPASRPNRGHAVYEPGSDTLYASLPKRGGGVYWLCGFLPAPNPQSDSSPANTSLLSPDKDRSCVPSIEASGPQPKNATKAPTIKEEDTALETPSKPRLSSSTKRRRKASLQTSVTDAQGHSVTRTSEASTSQVAGVYKPEGQPANAVSRSRSPYALPGTSPYAQSRTLRDAFPSPSSTVDANSLQQLDTEMGGVDLESNVQVNSEGSHAKRNSSPSSNNGNNSHAPKRHRKSIQPYAPPPSVLVYEDENARLSSENEQLRKEGQETKAKHEAEIHFLTERHADEKHGLQADLDTAVTERNAFRQLAQSLYAHKVDTQTALADRHEALTNVLEGLDRQRGELDMISVKARRELGPTAALHRDVDELLDDQEKKFKRTGLKSAWEGFVAESMQLE